MAHRLQPVLAHLRRAVLPTDGGPSDGQLLEWFIARRDEEAFAALVRRHGPMVLGVCRRVVGNCHDADDAFQATFLVLVRKAATIVPRDLVGNWLHGVAYRTALEARVSRARRRARETHVQELPHPMVEPETSRDWQPYLDRELNRLPEKYRVPLVLCDLEGRSRKEVARRLGLPEGTLSSRLAAARKLLARRLGRYGLSLSGSTLAAALAASAASASVPAALLASTIRITLLTAGGATGPGLVAAPVAALTKGVMQTMLLLKLRVALVALVVVGLLAGAGVMLAQPARPAQSAQENKAEPPPQVVAARDALLESEWYRSPVHLRTCTACHVGKQEARLPVGDQFTIQGVDVKKGLLTVSVLEPIHQNLGLWLDTIWDKNALLPDSHYNLALNAVIDNKQMGVTRSWDYGLHGPGHVLAGNRLAPFTSYFRILELQVKPTTRILIDGKERKLADLKVGLAVQIDYRPSGKADEKAQALNIVATGPKMACELHDVDLPTGTITVDREDEGKGEIVASEHAVVKDAAVTIDGKKGRFEDLKPGMRVVVQHSAIRPVLVAIDAVGPRVEAVLTTVDAPRNTIAVTIKNTHLSAGNVLVAPDVTVVLDGKKAALADLKPGMRVVLRMAAEADKSLVVGITTLKVLRKRR